MTIATAATRLQQDQHAIRQTIEAYADRLRESDVEAVIDLYTQDCVVLQPDADTVVGTDALAATYREAFQAIRIDVRFAFDDILVDGDFATAVTRAAGTVTMLEPGTAVPAQFRELWVLRRAGADWKISRYMFQTMSAK
jgi:uncharacterized protein (TIGR02246 family)